MCAAHLRVIDRRLEEEVFLVGVVPHDEGPVVQQNVQRDSEQFSAISFSKFDETDEHAQLLRKDEHDLVVRPGLDVVRRVKMLGVGGNGSVEMVRFNGQLMVMKTLLKAEKISRLLREIRIQRELAGAGGAPEVRGLGLRPARVIMTYTGQGYDEYVQTCTQQEVLRTLILVGQKLLEIHEKGFSHNDLKLDNITVGDSTQDVDVHIIDYGLTKRFGEVLRISRDAPKLPWYAPELFERKPVTPACDVYSFGDVIATVFEKVDSDSLRTTLSQLIADAREERPTDRPSLTTVIDRLKQIAKAAETIHLKAKEK